MDQTEQLARDLKLFADPATEFAFEVSASSTRIRMTRDGEVRDYLLNLASGEFNARHADGRRFNSVQALLASEEFVNVRAFRATQRRLLEPKQPHNYIEPEGELLANGARTSDLTLQSFREAVRPKVGQDLEILLLDGPAGIGKTSLVERIVYERSDAASSLPPMLHVASSGSRLTDLNKALAHATQILRARITFDQVPVLVRLGVLQVAIDGFDELVDPEGYKDAWSALRQFLADVGAGGPLVLSGRDTFFDQQSFEARLADRIPNLALAHARLHPISPESARRFLSAHGWSPEELQSAEAREWLKPGSYHLRPFFLAQIGTTAGWSELQESHGSPQSFLVSRFVAREAGIITKMVEVSQMVAENALWDFYGLIVEDMAIQESDTVDESFLAFACETAFDGKVSSTELGKLVFKAGSFGLLESEGSGSLRRFPHSELQNQFLGRIVAQGLEKSSVVSMFLRRGVVSSGLIEAFSDICETLATDRAEYIRRRLLQLLTDEPLADRLQSNAGALLLATLSANLQSVLELASVSIAEGKLIGSCNPARLTDVTFGHLDARGADCTSVVFEECYVGTLTAADDTKFGPSSPRNVSLLQVESDGGVKMVRSPDEIRGWIQTHSTPAAEFGNEDNLPFVKYFDRVCRKFARQHQIRNSAKDEAYFLVRDPLWEELRRVLGGRIVEELRGQTRGPRDSFFRMVAPEEFVQVPIASEEAKRVRAQVVARARELARCV